MDGDIKSVQSSNWVELHPDLLRTIYQKLYDTFDFINFRAVCKRWRAAAPLFEHPPQFPLLLERESLLSSEFQLYSLQTGKARRLQVPEAQNKEFSEQAQGYLVTYRVPGTGNNASPALLNPFTRAELPLPFGSFTFFKPIHVGANHIQNTNDVVIYMRGPNTGQHVGFWNSVENEWVLIANLPGFVEVYHNGRLFCNDYSSLSTKIFDLATRNTILEVRYPPDVTRDNFYCLVDGAGVLLGIHGRFSLYATDVSLEKCWFEVYRLDEEEKPPRWVKMSDIGELMIFLNSNNHGFCLSARDFVGMRGNCIYFTRWNGKLGCDCQTLIGRYGLRGNCQLLIGRYELGKDRSEEIGQRRYSEVTWIVPNLYASVCCSK